MLLLGTVAVVALSLLAISPQPAHATTPSLTIGQIQVFDPAGCPGTGWYSYTSSNGTQYNMVCQAANIYNCPNAAPLGFTFGYLSPSAISAPVNGVIVLFNGGDGTSPVGDATGNANGEFNMANYYFTQGYGIVQLAWNSPWQETDAVGNAGNPNPGNVQNAACRPATFLNWVYNNIYLPISTGGNPTAGMCAQGASAGSAQIAYSMAYYGSAGFLDNVELISGPVLSDIEQGCEEPPPVNVTICPSGQWGCLLGTGDSSWNLAPTYLTGANSGVGQWTYDSSCGVPTPVTSGSSGSNWLKQSIVDQSNITGLGATPTFSYGGTALSGWLCRSLQSQQSAQNCSQNYNEYQDYCPNNSSPQGEIFYSQITESIAPPHYDVYAVDQCGGPEGASNTLSQVPGYAVQPKSGIIDGFHAITYDMAGSGPPLNIQAQCFHGTHH